MKRSIVGSLRARSGGGRSTLPKQHYCCGCGTRIIRSRKSGRCQECYAALMDSGSNSSVLSGWLQGPDGTLTRIKCDDLAAELMRQSLENQPVLVPVTLVPQPSPPRWALTVYDIVKSNA